MDFVYIVFGILVTVITPSQTETILVNQTVYYVSRTTDRLLDYSTVRERCSSLDGGHLANVSPQTDLDHWAETLGLEESAPYWVEYTITPKPIVGDPSCTTIWVLRKTPTYRAIPESKNCSIQLMYICEITEVAKVLSSETHTITTLSDISYNRNIATSTLFAHAPASSGVQNHGRPGKYFRLTADGDATTILQERSTRWLESLSPDSVLISTLPSIYVPMSPRQLQQPFLSLHMANTERFIGHLPMTSTATMLESSFAPNILRTYPQASWQTPYMRSGSVSHSVGGISDAPYTSFISAVGYIDEHSHASVTYETLRETVTLQTDSLIMRDTTMRTVTAVPVCTQSLEKNCSECLKLLNTSTRLSNTELVWREQGTALSNTSLVVNTRDTGQAKRKLTCANDTRMSSRAIGWVAIVVISGIASLIVGMDLPILYRQTAHMLSNGRC